MQEIIKNYQKAEMKYSKQVNEILAQKQKIEDRIERAKEQLEELDEKFYHIPSPNFFDDLVEPLAVKLSEYFNKPYILQRSFNCVKSSASIFLVDDVNKAAKDQPNFRLTVFSYECEDGREWMVFDTGKTSAENGKKVYALLPTRFEEVVKLVK